MHASSKSQKTNGEPRDPGRSGPRWWLWGLIGSVIVAGGGLIAVAATAPGASAGVGALSAGTATSCDVPTVAGDVLPSVVTVAAAGSAGSGTGSGEVIKSDGYILTNNHVVSPAVGDGGQLSVLFSDGTSEPATLVGRDVLTDLAVLKVASTEGLQPIAIGSSASLVVGEPVVALGAPLGLSGTVTSGIVSALDRTIEVPADADSSALLVSAVQTDAAINPGNSGGALVNCAGQLVGIPTAGATAPSSNGESSSGNIGLGFAIPVDAAMTIANEIITNGRATHAYFGLQTLPIPPSAAVQAGVPGGLFVAGVAANGPAAKAGLQAGDVITTIAGQPAATNVQLQEQTLTKSPGDTVELGYVRDGKQATATVTLEAQP